MVLKQLIKVYDPYTCPIHELPCLEDMFLNRHLQNEDDCRIDSLSIRSYPLVLSPAIKTIMNNTRIISKSYIERVILLFSISKLDMDPLINRILEKETNVSIFANDEDVWEELENSNKINYKTRTIGKKRNISSFYWVKEWMVSRATPLGFNQRELAVYSLIYGLSYYHFQNKLISDKIKIENDYFLKILNKRDMLLDKTAN